MCLLNRLQCSWAICGYCKDWQTERALWSDLARFGLYALVLRKKQDSLDESAKSGRKQSKVRNHKRISLVYCATVLAFFLKWKEGYTRRLRVTFEYRKKWKKKVKKKKNGKFPGTGSPSWLGPLSRYNALPTELRGTCHEWRVNFKTIWNKRSTYCMNHVHKYSMERWVFGP